MEVNMICRHCNSDLVLRDAYAQWDEEAQEWVLLSVFDYSVCRKCDAEGNNVIKEVPIDNSP